MLSPEPSVLENFLHEHGQEVGQLPQTQRCGLGESLIYRLEGLETFWGSTSLSECSHKVFVHWFDTTSNALILRAHQLLELLFALAWQWSEEGQQQRAANLYSFLLQLDLMAGRISRAAQTAEVLLALRQRNASITWNLLESDGEPARLCEGSRWASRTPMMQWRYVWLRGLRRTAGEPEPDAQVMRWALLLFWEQLLTHYSELLPASQRPSVLLRLMEVYLEQGPCRFHSARRALDLLSQWAAATRRQSEPPAELPLVLEYAKLASKHLLREGSATGQALLAEQLELMFRLMSFQWPEHPSLTHLCLAVGELRQRSASAPLEEEHLQRATILFQHGFGLAEDPQQRKRFGELWLEVLCRWVSTGDPNAWPWVQGVLEEPTWPDSPASVLLSRGLLLLNMPGKESQRRHHARLCRHFARQALAKCDVETQPLEVAHARLLLTESALYLNAPQVEEHLDEWRRELQSIALLVRETQELSPSTKGQILLAWTLLTLSHTMLLGARSWQGGVRARLSQQVLCYAEQAESLFRLLGCPARTAECLWLQGCALQLWGNTHALPNQKRREALQRFQASLEELQRAPKPKQYLGAQTGHKPLYECIRRDLFRLAFLAAKEAPEAPRSSRLKPVPPLRRRSMDAVVLQGGHTRWLESKPSAGKDFASDEPWML